MRNMKNTRNILIDWYAAIQQLGVAFMKKKQLRW